MNEFIIYITEDLLKKAIAKGAPIHPTSYSDGWTKQVQLENPEYNLFTMDIVSPVVPYDVPTAEQLCGWLRSIHINVGVAMDLSDCGVRYTGSVQKPFAEVYWQGYFSKYEQAMLAAIDKALDLL